MCEGKWDIRIKRHGMLARNGLCVGIVTLLCLTVAMADPPAVHPTTGEPLVIDCLRGTPDAIDGDLSDWNLAAMTPAVVDDEAQLYMGQASWDDADDCSGEFYLLWDDVNIYMAVIVKDDKLSMNKSGGDIWNADAIEVFFATTNAVPPHDEHYQYGFNANEQTWNWCNMDTGGASAIDYLQVVATETDDGYICEAAIEYGEMLSLDWSVGSIIGFHPVIDDTDNGDREIQITWTGREAHDQSLGFGYLVLSEDRAIAKEIARDPSPESGEADVPVDAILSWSPGEYAATHDVYVGASFDDVNEATTPDSAGQSETTYDPGLLDYGQTYYWRVDEVNAAPNSTVFKGVVWNFATEPFGAAIDNVIATTNTVTDSLSSLENAVNGVGLNDNDEHSDAAPEMWLGMPVGADPAYLQFEFDRVYKLHEMLVWNYNVQFELVLGFGLKDVTVEFSENGTDWTVLGDEVFAQGTASPDYSANTTVSFGGVAAKYVKLTINSGWGVIGQFGLSEVRFLAIPVQARRPEPADGAADVSIETTLAWRAGRDSISHDVYLGVDADALPLVDTVEVASYTPGMLELGTTYCWKIDENQEGESWEGALWCFTTQPYLVVEDFESYDDEDNRIYDTWLDGYNVDGNGSQVGHIDAPFAEQTIVKGGKQSMPLFYDNADAPMSEAELTVGQDWSTSGIQSVTLSFYGDPANSGGQLYVKINNTKIPYDGAAVNLTKASWNLWSIDLATAGNVSNVGTLIIGVEGAGANGVVYIDDVRLYPEVLAYHRGSDITAAGDIVQGVPNDGVTTGGANNGWPAGESPDLAIDDDTATKFLHFKGNAEPTGIQVTPQAGATIVTGLTLTTANDAAERDPIAFELSGSNAGIDGPYTLIASGDIVDFSGEDAWPRFTLNETLITFDNDVAYTHYQVLFTTVRDAGSANSMQIAEIELIGSAP